MTSAELCTSAKVERVWQGASIACSNFKSRTSDATPVVRFNLASFCIYPTSASASLLRGFARGSNAFVGFDSSVNVPEMFKEVIRAEIVCGSFGELQFLDHCL